MPPNGCGAISRPCSFPHLVVNPTVSVGVAMASEAGRSLSTLLALADRALYRAKADGRNRVAPAPLVLVDAKGDSRPPARPAGRHAGPHRRLTSQRVGGRNRVALVLLVLVEVTGGDLVS